MTSGRDDDALSWDGDDDPTLDVRATAGDQATALPGERATTEVGGAVPGAALPAGYTPVGKGSEPFREPDSATAASAAGPDSEVEPAEASHVGNAELISLGVIGGFSVLYAVGWLIGGLRLQGTAEFLVAPLAYQVSLWLAVLAPLVWFATVLLLTRGRRLWVRFAWLIGGVVLLVPWPFIMVGAIGQ